MLFSVGTPATVLSSAVDALPLVIRSDEKHERLGGLLIELAEDGGKRPSSSVHPDSGQDGFKVNRHWYNPLWAQGYILLPPTVCQRTFREG